MWTHFFKVYQYININTVLYLIVTDGDLLLNGLVSFFPQMSSYKLFWLNLWGIEKMQKEESKTTVLFHLLIFVSQKPICHFVSGTFDLGILICYEYKYKKI